MTPEIIQEYLISLGWQVEAPPEQKINATVEKFEKKISWLQQLLNAFFKGIKDNKFVRGFIDKGDKFIESLSRKVLTFFTQTKGVITTLAAGITVAVIAIGAAITAVMVKFMGDMAKADMQVQIFARRMFTTVENARSLKAVMDAMGLKDMEDFKDVSVNPELRAQFFALRKATAGLGLNGDAKDGLKDIRAIQFEVQKTQVLLNYFWTELAANVGHFLDGPLKDLRGFLEWVNTGFKGNLGRIAYDLAEVFGIVGKIVDISLKLNPLFMLLRSSMDAMGSTMKEQLTPWEILLDIINKILDAFEWMLDAPDKIGRKLQNLGQGSGHGTGQGSGPGSYSGQSPMEMMAYYIKRIHDMLQPLVDWFTHLFNLILAKFGGVTSTAQNLGMTALHAVNPALGAAVDAGSILWGTKDKSSAAINAFLQNLSKKMNEPFTVTAGFSRVGHESHGKGLAFDIGLRGKSDTSILSLLHKVMSTPGFRIADLELTPAHYASVLRQMDRIGMDHSRVVNQHGRYWTGENLHVGLQPLTQNIQIAIHDAHDPHKTAQVVHKVLRDAQAQAVHTHRSALS